MKQPNATWIARGRLESSILHIDSLEKVGSDRLLENLLSLEYLPRLEKSPLPALIIGLDFPFSFPAPFAKILRESNQAYSSESTQTSQTYQTSETSETPETSRKSPPPQASPTLMTVTNSPHWVNLATLVSALPFEELLIQVQTAKPIMGGEIKRLTDNCTSPKAQSPLHLINPGMLKMTWQGMQLLLALHKEGFAILPFANTDSILPNRQSPEISGRARNSQRGDSQCGDIQRGDSQCGDIQRGDSPLAENPASEALPFRAEVMEVYPAAMLKFLGQPWRKYKGKDPEAKQLRQVILNNLAGQSDKLRSVNRIATAVPELSLPPSLEQFALASDDALDAVIAALAAAIAYLNPSQTAPPTQISTDLIALEGWIYVPQPKTIEATPEVMA